MSGPCPRGISSSLACRWDNRDCRETLQRHRKYLFAAAQDAAVAADASSRRERRAGERNRRRGVRVRTVTWTLVMCAYDRMS